MKPLLFLTLLGTASAAEMTVAWDANPEPDVKGYKLTIQSGDASRVIDVPGKTEVVADLKAGDVLRVRAYNVLGLEGPDSDPLAISAPGKAGGLRVKHTVEIQQSNNLGEWETISTVASYDSAARQEFFRVKNP